MFVRVSIIVPCYNESKRIADLLHAIFDQDFPLDQIELIVADGGSTDGTLVKIQEFSAAHPRFNLQVIRNPKQVIPTALNEAIAHSSGQVVIRLDAHSIPDRGYIKRSLEALEENKAANVGGVWEIQPGGESWIAKAIALAASHPLGAGDARYRINGRPGPVETVPFGAFRREWLDRIGPFNEELLTNEDFEYNARIRAAGGVVWFDPRIRSIYIARASLISLAQQYWRYGYWKLRMLLMHPRTLRWRQALPPLFVLAITILPVLSIFFPLLRGPLAVLLSSYLGVLVLSGARQAMIRRDATIMIGFPLALVTMHLAWGTGFLWSGLKRFLGG